MSCPECFNGHVHEGEPRGKAAVVHGLNSYVVDPPNAADVKGIIVIIPDAFGWEFPNSRLLADRYAEKGSWKVYIPDFMDGNAAPVWMLTSTKQLLAPGWNIFSKAYHAVRSLSAAIPWMLRTGIGKTHPVVHKFFADLRQDEGKDLPIGAAGFCWGGKHAVMLGQNAQVDGKPLVDAVFTGHPSFLQLPGDIEKLTAPVSFAIGDKDVQVNVQGCGQIKTIVEGLPEGSRGEMRIYENCGHGFCLRADVSFEDSTITKQAVEAEEQAVAWFQKHFKRGT